MENNDQQNLIPRRDRLIRTSGIVDSMMLHLIHHLMFIINHGDIQIEHKHKTELVNVVIVDY